VPDCLQLRPENEVFEIVNLDHLFSGSRFKLRRVVVALDGTGYRLHLHRCHRLLVRSAYQKAVRYCAFATDRLLLFASCASSAPGFAHDFCLFSRSLCDIQRTFLWLDASRYIGFTNSSNLKAFRSLIFHLLPSEVHPFLSP
jgi:hypothetical protein